jgi:23S rRNA (cytidine2498-2'-O)-methyltransferase
MHLLIWAEDSEGELRQELAQAFPDAAVQTSEGSLLQTELEIKPGQRLPYLVFARQLLPNAQTMRAESINAWAKEVFQAVSALPENQPWALHIEPHYAAKTASRMGARAWYSVRHAQGKKPLGPSVEKGQSEAGRHRCELIREAVVELLQKKRRHLLRELRKEPLPFTPTDSLVQVLLTSPESGFLSVTPAPMPFEQRHLLSPFPKGEVPLASDKAAPSRAFAKLVEAERRLGPAIKAGETCVDLGAAPGSWTYVAVTRGAKVLAVDRSELREDLMRDDHVEFVSGDAFRFEPRRPVDWLLCDVIAEPARTAKLLVDWLQRGWCRNFVVTIKLKDASGLDALNMLKRELPPLTREFYLSRLCANKKEACAFGEAQGS